MTQARLPTSVVVSLGLHGGALALFGLMMRAAPKQAARVVEGVDLLVRTPARPAAFPESARKPPSLSTLDFLKLALPSIPRVAPAEMPVAVPERKAALAAMPKLEDRAPKDLGPKLSALDLSRRPEAAARLEEVKLSRHQAAAALAALPRLEDVGRRRVRNLPRALALEDRRREAVAMQGLPDVAMKPTSRRRALAAVAALREAAPEERAPERGGLAALLPERPLLMEARPQAVVVPKIQRIEAAPPRPARRASAQADVARKKGVEIEGPLADRAVAASDVPRFPAWARDQGILEADVSIRFTVDEDGNVMPGLRVVNSSSYGRIDKLALDSLRNWRFAPKPGAGVEWGVITFRFVLE